jgi:hypothetical protein
MIPPNDATLLAYIEEALPVEQMTRIEFQLRGDEALRGRLTYLISQRDNGVHSIGDIWRRHRLSCPSRDEIGSLLLQAMSEEKMEYIHFHIHKMGCRYCKSNYEDLANSHHHEAVTARRRKYFQSSVGRLRSKE